MRSTTRLASWSLVVALAVGSSLFTSPTRIQAPSKPSVTIPADVTGYGLIFLRAQINGSDSMWFALDSGASFPFVIDSRRAQTLGLKLLNNQTLASGAGSGSYQVTQAKGISINVGGLEFNNQTVAVIALGSLEAVAGRNLDGLVGNNLFGSYVVEIDYVKQKVILHDPLTYAYTGSGESIALTQNGKYFFVPAKITMPGRRQVDGQFLVDTGGGLVTVVLNSTFAQAKNLFTSPQRMIFDHSLSGLGGETRLLVSRATTFALGNLMINQPVVYVSQDRGGALASSSFDGVIGGELLRRFKVIFDYPRHRLILEKNSYYSEPFEYDMSGIRLRAEGNDFRTFRVFQVIENSPAAAAKLQVGDILVAIDGTPSSTFSLDEIYQMMKQRGLQRVLSIRRGSRTFSVRIKLERLI